MIDMAKDTANTRPIPAVLAAAESGLMILFLVMGLVGTILAILLIAAALWRARVARRWLPAVLVGFVVVESVGRPRASGQGTRRGCSTSSGSSLSPLVARPETPSIEC